jgi:molecular chaperone GrpE
MSEKKERDIEVADGENEAVDVVAQEEGQRAEEASAGRGADDKGAEFAESSDAGTPQPDEQSDQGDEGQRLQARIEELEDQLLRVAADFENYRKRTARQYEQQVKLANERVLGDLLEIVDNLERALSAENGQSAPASFRKGVELIFIQLTTLLAKYDVTPIEAVGKPFDPTYHEAVMQVESEEHAEGVVALELSKGYMLGDKVLRHSKVGVSRG